jgi:hypothetical protein
MHGYSKCKCCVYASKRCSRLASPAWYHCHTHAHTVMIHSKRSMPQCIYYRAVEKNVQGAPRAMFSVAWANLSRKKNSACLTQDGMRMERVGLAQGCEFVHPQGFVFFFLVHSVVTCVCVEKWMRRTFALQSGYCVVHRPLILDK